MPEVVRRAADADARILLESTLAGPLDIRVRDQILAETGGNPLALLELPRGLTRRSSLAGSGSPGAASLRADRGELRPAAGGPAAADSAAAAACGGRPIG